MAKRQLLAASAFIAALCAGAVSAKARDDIVYGCSDLVVVGRLAKQDYQHVEIEDDLLGHGWVTADVKVDEVVFGHPRDSKLPIRYFAHTYMREDRDFVFVLRPIENGRHLVRSARLMETNPEIADRCSK